LSHDKKLIWVYILSAIFVAVNIFLIIKEIYWLTLLPVALLLMVLFFFSLDKVLYFIVFATPLAFTLKDFENQLSLSLPTEPLLFAVLVLFMIKMLSNENMTTGF